ncbi:unnamed protein product, partial [Musa textilis]
RRKISHSLVVKICDHEKGIKWNWIGRVVESWKHFLFHILDLSSMEQYATAKTWK